MNEYNLFNIIIYNNLYYNFYIGLLELNGGHFPNDQIKFGVNCYGTKPKGSISKLKKKDCPQ